MIRLNNRGRAGWISVCLMALLIVMINIPIIPKAMGGSPILFPVMLLAVGSLFGEGKLLIKEKSALFLIGLCIAFGVQILYKLSGISTAGIGVFSNPASFFFLAFMMDFVVLRADQKQRKFLFWTVIGSILLTLAVNTFMYLRLGFYYFERVSESDHLVTNAVNTQFTTALMIMGGICLIIMLHINKERRLPWLALFIIITLFNVLVCQRAIALILSAVMYSLILALNSKSKGFVIFLIILMGLACIVAYLNYGAVITWLTEHIGSERIGVKLAQIRKALDSGEISENNGSLGARAHLYMTSVQTWLQSFRSFFLGVGDHRNNNLVIGNHSEFIDLLAKFGVIIASLFYTLVFITLNWIRSSVVEKRDSIIYKQVMVILGIFLFRGLIGFVLFGSIAVQLFVFLPLAFSVLKEKERFWKI